jgi:ADP-ribose pyrophosphatase YjhB (NUDIX family)
LVSVTSGIIPAVPEPTEEQAATNRDVSGDVATLHAELGYTGPNTPPSRVTRLAAYGVICRDDRVLLCRVSPGHLGVGPWTLPGGGLAFGESPEDGAIREVEEETGLVCRITGSPRILTDTGLWPLAEPPIPYHQVRFVYPMDVVGGEERVEVGGSTDAFDWVAEAALGTVPIVPLVALALGRPVPEDG